MIENSQSSISGIRHPILCAFLRGFDSLAAIPSISSSNSRVGAKLNNEDRKMGTAIVAVSFDNLAL
jgi:hypothetical protein